MSIEAKINQRLENDRYFLNALALHREVFAKKISERLALYQELWLEHELDALVETSIKMCQQQKHLREKDLDKIVNTLIPVPPQALGRRVVPPLIVVTVGLLIGVGLLLSNLIPQLLPLVFGFSTASSLFHLVGFLDQTKQSILKPTRSNRLAIMTTIIGVGFATLGLIFPTVALLFGVMNAAFLLGTSGFSIANQVNKLQKKSDDSVKARTRAIKIATTIIVAGLTIGALFFPPLHFVTGIVAGIGSLALIINKVVQAQQKKNTIPSSTQKNIIKKLSNDITPTSATTSFKPAHVNTQDVHQYQQTRREANARYDWFLRYQHNGNNVELPTTEMLQKIPAYHSHTIAGTKPWDYILLKLTHDNFVRIYRHEIVVDQINTTTLAACTELVKAMKWDHFEFNQPSLEKSLATEGKGNSAYTKNLKALIDSNHSATPEMDAMKNILKGSV